MLQGAAAAIAEMAADRLGARAGSENFHRFAVHALALFRQNPGAHAIARRCEGQKHLATLVKGHAIAAHADGVDGELDLGHLISLRTTPPRSAASRNSLLPSGPLSGLSTTPRTRQP